MFTHVPTPVPWVTVFSDENIEVDGVLYYRTRKILGCRPKFVISERGIIVKVDMGGSGAHGQYHLWHNLEAADRRYFTVPVAFGRHDYSSQYNAYWVAEALYDVEKAKPAGDAPYDLQEIARELQRKYHIVDWHHSQWKIVDGQVLIHDYSSSWDGDVIDCDECDSAMQRR